MTRITNTDHILALLRAQLERARRAKKTDATPRQHASGPMRRVQQLASAHASEADVARALVAGLLSEEFGPALAVDPSFQSVVDDVHRALEHDDTARALLRQAIAELSESQS